MKNMVSMGIIPLVHAPLTIALTIVSTDTLCYCIVDCREYGMHNTREREQSISSVCVHHR